MTIKKIGHCCLLIQEGALTILTDPGTYSTAQNEVTGVDVILITHEHADHFHIESVQALLANNPQATIYTVPGVGSLLKKAQVKYQLLGDSQKVTIHDVLIEGYGQKHADMYPGWPAVDNTGYLIANRLWYPGDAFNSPHRPIEILALPVAAPWLKLSEAIDYAKMLKPKFVFPVHDGILKQAGIAHRLPEKFLSESGIEWRVIEIEKTESF